jgi:predicted cupin superfamily sugar epimerase
MIELSGLTAADVVTRLGLVPLPGEGGYWKDGFRTNEMNSILFLMTDSAEGFSALHRLKITEGWQWLAGAPVRMLQFKSATDAVVQVLDEKNSQTVVPIDTWQAARTTGQWSLVSCWCAPQFTDDVFELGNRQSLINDFPEFANLIEEFTR